MCTLFPTHLHACLRYIQRATSVQRYPALDLADENKIFVKGHSFDGHKKRRHFLLACLCTAGKPAKRKTSISSSCEILCLIYANARIAYFMWQNANIGDKYAWRALYLWVCSLYDFWQSSCSVRAIARDWTPTLTLRTWRAHRQDSLGFCTWDSGWINILCALFSGWGVCVGTIFERNNGSRITRNRSEVTTPQRS